MNNINELWKNDQTVDLATLLLNSANILANSYGILYHLHNRERWFGKSADQSGNDWALEASLTPFRAISGNADFGSDLNDEALVLGTEDTPIITSQTHFDLHRLLIVGVSVDTPYILRIVYGTGTMADAITAGQYSDVMVKFDSVNPTVSAGTPVDLVFPRNLNGNKIWIQTKNATNNATIDFFVGVHGYIVS